MSTSTCNVPGFYNPNPPRTVIHQTHAKALDAMADQVKTYCQKGGDALACHDATVAYSAHNQAAASGVYATSKPAPTVASKVIHDITPTSVIDARTYADLVAVSNAQAAQHAATGQFHMWSVGPCNPCYFPTSATNTASF